MTLESWLLLTFEKWTVVGDADQIIHCQMREGAFAVCSGSTAEMDVAQSELDVLEGTKPEFDNCRHEHEAFPELH